MSKSMINNRFLEETLFAIADGYCVINDTEGGSFRLFEGIRQRTAFEAF